MSSSPTFSGGRGMRLEKVIGMSATNKNMVDVVCEPRLPKNCNNVIEGTNSATSALELLAYPVGCVVVVATSGNKQKQYVRVAKPVSCVAFSPCGEFLAVGERGHNPAITVWQIKNGERKADLKGHKFGVSCLKFSPCGERLASVGFEHDDTLKVWNWAKALEKQEGAEEEVLLCEGKLDTPGLALEYAMMPDGHSQQLITVGAQEIRFWELKENEKKGFDLVGHKAGVMPDYKDAVFTDAVFDPASRSLLISTECGSLVCIGPNRLMDKWVFLESSACHSLTLAHGRVACACAEGIVRVFDAESFQYIATMPFPRRLDQTLDAQNETPEQYLSDKTKGQQGGGRGGEEEYDEEKSGAVYADAISVHWGSGGETLTVVYSDRGLYAWDISDTDSIVRRSCYLVHPTSVTGIQCMPSASKSDSTFVTCSEDNTLRFWKLGNSKKKQSKDRLWCNTYSNELVREIRIEDRRQQQQQNEEPNDYKESDGIQCISVSQNGKMIATGDKAGGVFVYDLASEQAVLDQRKTHNGQVMSVEFSPPLDTTFSGGKSDLSTEAVGSGKEQQHFLLATGGRDRLVNLFDSRNLSSGAVKTLKNHSATVTAVKFSTDGQKLLSAGGDKTIVLCKVDQESSSGSVPPKISREQSVAMPQQGTAFAVDIDASGKYFCTAGQDKKINIWSLNNGKAIRSYKLSEGGFDNAGELSAVRLDPAGMFCATGSQDKSVRLFDFYSGECVARSAGHSEAITGLAFSRDCKRLISVARDGCMFVWRLAPEITQAIKERQQEIEMQATLRSDKNENVQIQAQAFAHPERCVGEKNVPAEEDEADVILLEAEEKSKSEFFASDELPTWAKTKAREALSSAAIDVDDDSSSTCSNESTGSSSNNTSTTSPTETPTLEEQQKQKEIEEGCQIPEAGNLEDMPVSPNESVSSVVSTAPREALPKFQQPRSLAQERKSLKMKETNQSVRRMRNQLKGLGLLEATLNKPQIIPEEEEQQQGEQVSSEKQGNQLERRLEQDATTPVVDVDEEDVSEEGVPGLVSPGAIEQNGQYGQKPSTALSSLSALSPLKTLEIPGDQSTSKNNPLASAFRNIGTNQDHKPEAPAGGQAFAYTPGAPLRTADEARSACGYALAQLQAAMSSTADIFAQVAQLDQNLEQSIESVRDGDPKEHFTKDVLLTSRSNVQGVMGEFQAQLGQMAGNLESINSYRSTACENPSLPGSVNPNNFNNSMFLGSQMAGGLQGMQMQAMMDKLTSISSMLERAQQQQEQVTKR